MADDLVVGGGVLGQKVSGKRRILDAIPLQGSVHAVKYTSDEVVSKCPVTGQPDFYTVTIHLSRSNFGIESKSLKLYLQSFMDEGQFCEAFADTVCQEVVLTTKAEIVTVTIKQKPRGGVSIEAHAYCKTGSDDA